MRAPRLSSARSDRRVEAAPPGSLGEGPEAGGGELDGEGKAIESATDAIDDRFGRPIRVEAWLYRTSTIPEELDGVRWHQAHDGNKELARDAERFATSGHHPEARHRSDQGLGKGSRLIDDVLAVVEDDDEGAAGEVPGDELRRRSSGLVIAQSRTRGAECRSHSRGDGCGIGDARELHQPGATGVLIATPRRSDDSQASLADPTGADQCD